MNFSIVITTYNRLNLLKRAIDRALAQTVPCEVIVADDCSSDGTQAYVEARCEAMTQAGDRRLIYHRNPKNLGHSATVNAGVAQATGDWVKLVDDDDYLATNCIEQMAKAIALHPQAVLCSCQAAQVNADGVELSRTRKVGPGHAFYIPQEDIHYGMLLELLPFGTTIQVAFSREAFLKSGGWDSHFDTNFDDTDSWVKISQFGDAIFINECLTYRVIWPGEYNSKFPVEERLKTNLLIKDKIYSLVNPKYRDDIPKLTDIHNYLKLHWSIVALRSGKWLSAVKLAFPASFSPVAWYLLLQVKFNQLAYLEPSSSLRNLEQNILVV